MNLAEKMRPRAWAEVVGQDKALEQIQRVSTLGGYGGRSWWITGASGTGKTTIARLIAAEVADDMAVTEIDASALTAEALREWVEGIRLYRLGMRPGVALIVNEAHGLRADMVRRLLVALEPGKGGLPDHAVVIFTTTNDGQESLFEGSIEEGPLLSRCTCIQLARRGLAEAFAEHVRAKSVELGVDGLPADRYLKAIKECRNNCRALWERVERGTI